MPEVSRCVEFMRSAGCSLPSRTSGSTEPGSGFPFELPGVPDQGGGVSVFTAVKEPLGLMLRPVTTELEMLVIERLERPQLDRTVQ